MVPNATVQPSPTMWGMPCDVQADVGGEDAEMPDKPATLDDYGDMVEVVGEGRSAGVMRDEDDVGGQVAPVMVRSGR